jgi:hypothetical protein
MVAKTPKAHATKWNVVVGLDRHIVRRFAEQVAAEAARDIHVRRGCKAYVLPPVAARGGKDPDR